MAPTTERTFAIAGVALLVVAVVTVVATPATGRNDRALAFDASVPAEYDFPAPTTVNGVARVDGERFDSLSVALDAAEPSDTVQLSGRFAENVTVDTPNITLVSADGRLAVVDGGGKGDVLTIVAPNVTVRRLWIRNSGYATQDNDAGIWIEGRDTRIVDSRVTAITFGIWINGVDDVVLRNNTIVGRESITPMTNRGNGIQIWKTEGSLIVDNHITDVRDGIYYSWASHVLARDNTMWDLRYGVHYMYSDDCRLVNNTAFDNDVGYALMVSEDLTLRRNVAVNNTGRSGHGLLLKSVDDSRLVGNHLIDNDRGFYIYNSVNNTIFHNLVLENDVGVYLAAGSVRSHVFENSFIRNDDPVNVDIGRQVAWNGSTRGNYWSGARSSDVDHDRINEIPYRPAGLVEQIVRQNPNIVIFTSSPAFDVIRLAQSTLPVIESNGIIDYHPLAKSPHDWRRYYARD